MSLIIFVGALLFLLYPALSKQNVSFIDYFILFCLYFDAMTVFTGGQHANFNHFQRLIVLLFSLYYLFYQVHRASKPHKYVLLSSLLFLSVVLFFPILRGGDIKSTIVTHFLSNYASIIILPIAFHYYSYKGNIINLLRSGYYFILTWTAVVIFFSLLDIDISPRHMGHMGSQTFGGGIFYFGDMGRRGAITYISFALLLVPLLYKFYGYRQKMFLLFGSGFFLTIMFVALKRFSFVVIILGLLNYLINSSISKKTKRGVLFGVVTIVLFVFFTTDINELMLQRYEMRGGQAQFSLEAVEGDIRIYEPLYVATYVFGGTVKEILIGKEFDRTIDIFAERHTHIDRAIHNQYAQYILLYGIVGLVIYLAIFIFLYYGVRKMKKLAKTHSRDAQEEYWVVFQNLVLIFLAAGMVGGHIHVTFRGLVLVFAGGIAGHFYKQIKNTSFEQMSINDAK